MHFEAWNSKDRSTSALKIPETSSRCTRIVQRPCLEPDWGRCSCFRRSRWWRWNWISYPCSTWRQRCPPWGERTDWFPCIHRDSRRSNSRRCRRLERLSSSIPSRRSWWWAGSDNSVSVGLLRCNPHLKSSSVERILAPLLSGISRASVRKWNMRVFILRDFFFVFVFFFA